MKIDVTNFQEQVLDASREKPVLVDFWAPWCGPCRQLGPILEKLAGEDDSFVLAKLNTDEDPVTSTRYGIRSIPAVKLFQDGEVKDEFIGALPEAQVRRWLKSALPSKNREQVEQARALADAGDAASAETVLEDVLAGSPDDGDAAIVLARLVVFRQPERAVELAHIATRADARFVPDSQAIHDVAELRGQNPESLPDDPGRQPYLEALAALSRGEVDDALDRFVNSVRLNRHYHNDAARKATLALFTLLGPHHELTRRHRRALESALF